MIFGVLHLAEDGCRLKTEGSQSLLLNNADFVATGFRRYSFLAGSRLMMIFNMHDSLLEILL